jgi:hypothetical protein
MISKCLIFLVMLSCTPIEAAQPGILKGHVKIISSQEVQLADETQSQANELDYADFPLLILSQDRKKEIARITADTKGDYRIELPPGDYILDVQRKPGRLRAKPEPFKVVSGQTAHVDISIDTGVR